MQVWSSVMRMAERTSFPDVLMLAVVERLARSDVRRLARLPETAEAEFVAEMARLPIEALNGGAKTLHEELPPEFFDLVLGPHRKYSCCRYPVATTSLAEAEMLALNETIEHAALADGQRILELNGGWGSLALHAAEQLPNATVVCVTRSQAQRRYVEAKARERVLPNLSAVVADMNVFATADRFDRIVSVEMFGRVANWRALLARARDWLEPDGRLFLNVFAHQTCCHRFDASHPVGWLAQHFLAGSLMPSHGLPHRFEDLFEVEAEWRWSGANYRRTALDWLGDFDSNRARIDEILLQVYGDQAELWRRRWRLYFLAIAGWFGHAGGSEWGVSHYRMAPAPRG
ncbi:MAG: class I SAM-dependent methyltransferase [Hyphomicrobiales bacterium]|nr:class I SAM-dependent methyltransferase [Hyphomicrobiales bacterium]MBV8662916.1 class I SAM-dependent methyltransferase [Hyphomicrobiales bacterium]